MFVNLINHSHYSLMKSALSVNDIINFSLKENKACACLIDIDTMFGTIEFYNACLKNNLKPIIGVQINDIVYIAKDNEGLKQLYKLSSKQQTNISNCYTISLTNNNIEGSFKHFLIKDIAAKENFCSLSDEKIVLKAVNAIKEGITLEEVKINCENTNMLTEEEAIKIYSSSAISNLEEIINSVDVSISQNQKINFVNFDKTRSSKEYLEELCQHGLKRKITNITEVYTERLKTELQVINQMGFNDYFLVVQDFINYAKANNIYIGPGRGSAAGSLVSYVLNITEVDPIPNNLIFERFLNIDRKTMPDIDTDIEDDLRYKVVEYLFNKWGHDKVAHIITFQRMKAKMALTDVGRILGIDIKIVKSITGLFGLQHENEILSAVKTNDKIKQYYDSYPELFNIADKLLGMPRQSGIHAAGLVICNEDLTNILPVLHIEDKVVLQYEMNYVEPLGLIKMDLLGLSNLSTIKKIIELIKSTKNYDINLNEIELNNENVFKQLSTGDTIGIFQLESNGMTNLIRQLKPKNIEDISLVLALYRPGPMQNIKTFLENKSNPSKIVYLNDTFKKYLSNTFNVIVYQEQMMEIIKSMCNYSFAKADIFRRIMSKKKHDELKKLEIEFLQDAVKNGYSESDSENVFGYIESFADYGFNHSHSLSYAYIAYWMAYLKYYYPREFITVSLETNNGAQEKVNSYVEEAKALNQKVLQPSILHSLETISIYEESILFGFNFIKGIGTSVSSKIIDIRTKYSFKTFSQVISLLLKNGLGKSTIETLIKAGCFDELLEGKTRFYLINNIDNILIGSKYLKEDGEFIVEPTLNDTTPTPEQLTELKNLQFELLGIDFSPVEENKELSALRKQKNAVAIAIASSNEGKYKVIATINTIKSLNTKYGAQMAFVNASDETKAIKLTLWPGTYSKYKDILKVGDTYLFDITNDAKGIVCNSLEKI